jgi:signal transduction histidine kinase
VSGISFTSTHTHLLSMLADIAVIALENARQYTDMRHKLARQVKEFATLQAIAGQLDAVTDFEMRARLALSLILNTINAEAGVLAWATGQHQISPRYIAQGALGGLGVNLPADDPTKPWWNEQNLQEVIQTGQPLLKNNFKQSHNGNGFNARSRLAVPMRRGKQVIGAINLECISPHVFTQNDLHFVSSVANQVAIVLEDTLLQEKACTDQQFLSMLMDMVDRAVWFIDADLNIVAQNEIAGQLTGRFEVVGRPVSDFIPSRPALCQLIDRALTERQPISFDDGVWLITKDNQPVAIRGKIAPVTQGEHVTGVLCVFQPVTVESNGNLVRQEFANMTAHLLRTPLSFLQTSIDLLRTTALTPDEQQTILNRMWERSRSLAEFTDELLEMLHMETQHVQMYVEPIELLPVLERVLNLVRCEETGQSFHLVGPTALPLVAADAAKTELVLFNLLTNAIKRSPAAGCIKIETDAADDEVRIVISDQGEALPAKQVERIFGQFYPVNDDNGKIPSTYHLGLYTTKRLVELQNGRIWAENRSDRGVQFSFALPVWEQK